MRTKALLLITLLTTMTHAFAAKDLLFSPDDQGDVVIHNRILAKVNGKAISVIDVTKKLDLLFYRQFPEYSSSAHARHQFYSVNWKRVVTDLIDKELILADAEENKMTVTPGDVRQEMESAFGPNIYANLDKIGLTYDEARNIIEGDIILRRMMYARVNNKAQKKVTPEATRLAYEEFAAKNIRPDEWSYHVISIRDENASNAEEIGTRAHHLLIKEAVPIESLTKTLNQYQSIPDSTSLTVSQEYHHTDQDVSSAYKEILTALKVGEVSHPIAQKTRNGKGTVYRIFILNDLKHGGKIPYNEVEIKIRNKLIDQAMNEETELYLKRMHTHFDVEDSQLKEIISSDFEPYSFYRG